MHREAQRCNVNVMHDLCVFVTRLFKIPKHPCSCFPIWQLSQQRPSPSYPCYVRCHRIKSSCRLFYGNTDQTSKQQNCCFQIRCCFKTNKQKNPTSLMKFSSIYDPAVDCTRLFSKSENKLQPLCAALCVMTYRSLVWLHTSACTRLPRDVACTRSTGTYCCFLFRLNDYLISPLK